MTRPSSLDLGPPKTPTTPSASFKTYEYHKLSPREPLSPSASSPRNSSNRLWTQNQQRRIFLQHLTQWALSHDSSPYFHGTISLLPQDSRAGKEIALGKAVSCILTDNFFTDARKKIIIRLFLSQEDMSTNSRDTKRLRRHDSMEIFSADWDPSEPLKDDASSYLESCDDRQSPRKAHGASHGYHKLVVRCGAGWMSARDYFSKLYFTHLHAQKVITRRHIHTMDDSLKLRSQQLGSPPSPKDTVTIRPLFQPFRRLPPELQEMIFRTAAGLNGVYDLCYDRHVVPRHRDRIQSPISLATMFGISKAMNQHLLPYIYHSTDFHFGLTGFTNYLWQSGPTRRQEIRRLTFHFGKLALLHCIRWLSPDPVFELLEPPVLTTPRSLQYFWRCQIQDLAQEVHLFTLTIDIKGIPVADLPMIVRILRSAFGGIERVLFVETNKQGDSKKVAADDERLSHLEVEQRWREVCAGYFERHKRHEYFFKNMLMRLEAEEFEKLMDEEKEFFGDNKVGACESE